MDKMFEKVAKDLYKSSEKESYCLIVHEKCLNDEARHNWVYKKQTPTNLKKYNSFIEKIKKNNNNNTSNVHCPVKGVAIKLLNLCVIGSKN